MVNVIIILSKLQPILAFADQEISQRDESHDGDDHWYLYRWHFSDDLI